MGFLGFEANHIYTRSGPRKKRRFACDLPSFAEHPLSFASLFNQVLVFFQGENGPGGGSFSVAFWGPMIWVITLPETNMFAPENGWFEYYFPIGSRPIFRGYVLVLGRVCVK